MNVHVPEYTVRVGTLLEWRSEFVPRRFSFNVQIWIYRYLVARDGEACSRCGREPGQGVKKEGVKNETHTEGVNNNPESLPLRFQIHHVDGNPGNNDPSNLELLCFNCNLYCRSHPEPRHNPNSPKNASVRVEGYPSTRIIREAINFSDDSASPAMKANALYEVQAREWCLEQIGESNNGFYLKQDAIAGMSELVGCSPLTAGRYLMKLVGPLGPLQEVKDMLGGIMLTWKPEYRPKKSIYLDLDEFKDDPDAIRSHMKREDNIDD